MGSGPKDPKADPAATTAAPPEDPDEAAIRDWSCRALRIYLPKDPAPLPYKLPDADPALRQRAAVALRQLRRATLPNGFIDRLLEVLRVERMRDDETKDWPTDGEDRKAVREIAKQALKLRSALLEVSPKAAININTACVRLVNDIELPQRMMRELQTLHDALVASVEYLDDQSRLRAHVNVVTAIADVVGQMGIEPSVSATSRFHSICEAAFALADVTIERKGKLHRPSPTGSIRAYMSRGHSGVRDFWHLE